MFKGKQREYEGWIILNDLGKPMAYPQWDFKSPLYPSKKSALKDKWCWEFTGHRPCKVKIILPDKLPPVHD